MLRVALLAALALAAAVPATAQAYWDIAADGNPLITTSSQIPVEDFELLVCPPAGAACTSASFSSDPTRVGVYTPGETAAGTTFEIRRARDGFVERSPVWQGRAAASTPPSVSGNASTGLHVTPVAATWTGGWADDTSSSLLFACTTPEGTSCTLLPPASTCAVPCLEPPKGNFLPSDGGPAALFPALEGNYLIAVDQRLPSDRRGWPIASRAAWGFGYAYDASTWSATWKPVSRSAPVKIAKGILEVLEGKPVTVTLRERALRAKGRLNVGRITCPRATCKVTVKVSGGGKKAVTTTFVAKQGSTAITTPVRRGKLTVRVHADGVLARTGTVMSR